MSYVSNGSKLVPLCVFKISTSLESTVATYSHHFCALLTNTEYPNNRGLMRSLTLIYTSGFFC